MALFLILMFLGYTFKSSLAIYLHIQHQEGKYYCAIDYTCIEPLLRLQHDLCTAN